MTDGWPGSSVLRCPSGVLPTAVSSLSLFLFIHLHQFVYADLIFSVHHSLYLNEVVLLLLPLPLCQTLNMSTFILVLCNFSPFLPLLFSQEKRRQQDEQDRARREMEDEKLRLQQLKVWHAHSVWCNLSHSLTHIRSLNFTQLKSSVDSCRLVSKQSSSKLISLFHTHSLARIYTHTWTAQPSKHPGSANLLQS